MTNDAAVAWQWLDTSNFRKNIPPAAVREHWNPLYSATTVAELRARIAELEAALMACNELSAQRLFALNKALANAQKV